MNLLFDLFGGWVGWDVGLGSGWWRDGIAVRGIYTLVMELGWVDFNVG
jgi:hypothetical protein